MSKVSQYVKCLIDQGADPRDFRLGLAETLRVSVAEIDAEIATHAIPGAAELALTHEAYCNSGRALRAEARAARQHENGLENS